MRNKRKGILMASAILGSAAIVSTGFAAWVITVNETATATGNITVDTVQDKTHLISFKSGVTETTLNDVIYFGSSNNTSTSGWLTNDNEKVANLVANFTVEVTNYSTCELTISFGDDLPEALSETKVDGKRLFGDPVITASDFVAVPSSPTKSGTVDVTVTFSWGEYFKLDGNVVNPYEFYNAQTNPLAEIRSGVTYAADAVSTLGIIEALQGTLSYSLSIVTATSDSAKVNP